MTEDSHQRTQHTTGALVAQAREREQPMTPASLTTAAHMAATATPPTLRATVPAAPLSFSALLEMTLAQRAYLASVVRLELMQGEHLQGRCPLVGTSTAPLATVPAPTADRNKVHTCPMCATRYSQRQHEHLHWAWEGNIYNLAELWQVTKRAREVLEEIGQALREDDEWKELAAAIDAELAADLGDEYTDIQRQDVPYAWP